MKRGAERSKLTATVHTLLRTAIASFFLAVSLGLLPGTHGGAILAPLIGEAAGRSLGGGLTFIAAYMLMCGIAPRQAAVLLAALVGLAGLIASRQAGLAMGDLYWRDAALALTLLLSTLALDRRAAFRARLIRRKPRVRRIEVRQRVVPRRVMLPAAGVSARPTLRRARLLAVPAAGMRPAAATLRLRFEGEAPEPGLAQETAA